MASRAQQGSATSLARYATQKQPGDPDIFNGSTSRDYCNSFWGPTDNGPNIMFARMRGASKTTDELRNFWNERYVIEEEYAQRLAKLAKAPIGGDEIGELRTSLDTLRAETERQAETHMELANQIKLDLEAPTAAFHQKQVNYRRNVQAPLERKLKDRTLNENFIKKARDKYEADCLRINSYTQQATYMQGSDLQKVKLKLQRTEQTMAGNLKDFIRFTSDSVELASTWEKEWKEFCDSCQDIEEERMDFMKDILWTYANDISTICVADDQSCERIRTALDQLEPERDVENFANEFGTGNTIIVPVEAQPVNTGEALRPSSPIVRHVEYPRITGRLAPTYPDEQAHPDEPHSRQASVDVGPQGHGITNGGGGSPYSVASREAPSVASITPNNYPTRSTASPPQTSPPNHPPPPVPEAPASISSVSSMSMSSITTRTPSPVSRPYRESQPLPVLPTSVNYGGPGRAQTPPPPLPTQQNTQEQGNKILFYVKALYDYTATIDEEFDFQAGDVIAVTATPDDGWWSGELLDESRKVEGRNVFPSNFVCLF